MSILDDAIREHLELKRAHGADEGELQRLEDEAFGPARRPDEVDRFAEAPTEFLLSPSEEPAAEPEIADERERGGRRPDIADLQEAPPSGPPAGFEAPDEAAADAPPPPADEAPVDLPPPAAVEEEHPAGEHEIVADPDTEERRAIADQPTQMFDVEAEIGKPEDAAESEPDAAGSGGSEADAAAEPPAAATEPEEDSGEFDFFDEQRLSDELDQALEAPVDEEDDEYDYDPETGHEDVLEDTPRFLESKPEDDDLWFEQKPPKDFDLD